MSFEAQDLLCSEGSFELPFFRENINTPSYNPSIDLTYHPRIENELYRDIFFDHELFHNTLSYLPSVCFQRVISFLIYKEFARDKFESSSKLSALSPSKNPTIKMLKAIFDEVYRLNAATQEAFAIQKDYHGYGNRLEKEGINTEKWLTEAIKRTAEDLTPCSSKSENMKPSKSRLKETCKTFCRSDFMRKASGMMRGFTFAPPLPPIQFPSKNERLDHAEINLATAEKLTEQFKQKYHQFPYSPWERFVRLVSMAEEMENSTTKYSIEDYLERIKSYETFDNEALYVEPSPKRLRSSLTCLGEENMIGMDNVCRDKLSLPRFCPVDMLSKQGIDVSLDGFGEPSVKPNDGIGEILRCRKIQYPSNIHFRTTKIPLRANIFGRTFKTGKRFKVPYRKQTRFSILRAGEIPHINWPRRAFLIASEALRDVVFNQPELAQKYKRIVLTDYSFIPPESSSSGRLSSFVGELKKEGLLSRLKSKIGLPNSQEVSPFISFDAEEGTKCSDSFVIRFA